jgi:hypothetical protein
LRAHWAFYRLDLCDQCGFVSASLRALILELLVLILDDTPLTVGPAAEHHVLKQLVLHAFLYEQRCVLLATIVICIVHLAAVVNILYLFFLFPIYQNTYMNKKYNFPSFHRVSTVHSTLLNTVFFGRDQLRHVYALGRTAESRGIVTMCFVTRTNGTNKDEALSLPKFFSVSSS